MRRAHVLHTIDGRVRVRVDAVKNDSCQATIISRQIRRIGGTLDVTANPLTGSVTIRYDPAQMSLDAIMSALSVILGTRLPTAPPATISKARSRLLSAASASLVDTVLKAAIETALRRALVAVL